MDTSIRLPLKFPDADPAASRISSNLKACGPADPLTIRDDQITFCMIEQCRSCVWVGESGHDDLIPVSILTPAMAETVIQGIVITTRGKRSFWITNR
jgi:hypothetical protein